MYEEYYGFVQAPFSLTPDPRFLYRSESHDVALQQLWQAIRRKEGFIVLTGDLGTGKTTLCRTILEQFDATTFTALVVYPFLSIEELLREVLLSLGIASKDAVRRGRLAAATKHELIRALYDFLLAMAPLRGSAVLIIDEAQHLSADVLEELRVLSNLETNERKLLQIVLVGQLALLDVLHDARLRQLDQRISIRCRLKPLNRDELEAYITHRLGVARGSTVVSFSPEAIDLVHTLSEGVPRTVNLICDRALMSGCAAQTNRIGAREVLAAAGMLDMAVPPSVQRWQVVRGAVHQTWRAAALVVLLLTIATVAYGAYELGNPLELLNVDTIPPQAAPRLTVALPATAPMAPDTEPNLMTRPAMWGYSVLVAAFEQPRDAVRAETLLRARKLPVFAIDMRYADGSVRRRLFVGRFASRQEANATQQQVASAFASARVTRADQERLP